MPVENELIISEPPSDLTVDQINSITGLQCTYEVLPNGSGHVVANAPLTQALIDKLALRARMGTAEYTIRNNAQAALANNKAWRDNAYGQLITGADQIIAAAGSSTQEKQLAQAVKSLANQVNDLSGQNNALIRLVLQQFDATT